MKAVLAVATLDLRRLWIGVLSAGVAIGLFPSLVRSLSVEATAQETLPFAIGAAAVIAGAAFGMDFADNKPSFFFARPMSTSAMFAGRVAAMLGLVVLSTATFLSVQWVSGLVWPALPVARVRPWHLVVIAVGWSVALFFSLAAAVHVRQRVTVGVRAFVLGGLRLIGVLALTALAIALFLDILMRAYDSPVPVYILVSSYVISGFIASCAAIELGRSNRLRITEVLNLGMYIHTTLTVVTLVIVWFYVLRLGPGAITSITGATPSPDGAAAYVAARVDRGSDIYFPRFRVDLSTGDVRRLDRGALNAAREMRGQWQSRDGGTQVWTDQTPMLLRSIRQLLVMRSSPFHFQSGFGAEHVLALPNGFSLDFDWEIKGLPVDILPSSGGDVFAFHWVDRAGPHLAFMSPARGQLSAVDAEVLRGIKRAWVFLPSGQIRVAFQRGVEKVEDVQVVDIDPATGKVTPLASAAFGPQGHWSTVRFDDSASRLLVEGGLANERRAMLVRLDGSPQPAVQTLAIVKAGIESAFLSDGRVVVLFRQPPQSELRFFSTTGEPVLTVPLADGFAKLGNEPFPNVLIVSTLQRAQSSVRLLDTTSGKLLRQIDGFHAPAPYLAYLSDPAPPASPAARILMSKETLYLLPSLTDEPRRLLPQ